MAIRKKPLARVEGVTRAVSSGIWVETRGARRGSGFAHRKERILEVFD
jgi:hypothetical protein